MQLTTFNVHKENFLSDQADPMVEARFSPDGKWILTATDNGSAALWDLDTTEKLFDLIGHKEMIMCAEFSANGLMCATSSMDNTAIVWNLQDGVIIHLLEGHEDLVSKITFSKDMN